MINYRKSHVLVSCMYYVFYIIELLDLTMGRYHTTGHCFLVVIVAL